ncbi:hypothetical protein CJ179_38765 [Rhodococcus sp. ACS1]|uniref:single-stranded DNA-binding protein n=1 Tax=Rhodococcus sp. ACS1 TaxID=2028570 RepID=UPI000BB0EA7C|nr:single-stranded DNA-binding protein [Rhodococcus sp. ACS1]PBC38544.1 hypothetical protein CJ179_38765 [Rhodococcus sp. ACS1]
MLSTLTGTYRAATDVELSFIGQGTAKATVRLVNSKSKKQDDGTYKDIATHWTTAIAWRDDAEKLAEQLSKGDEIHVTAHPETESWEDKTTGEKKSKEVLTLAHFKVFKRQQQNGGQSFQQASQQSRGGFGGPTQQGGGDPWASAPTQGSFGGGYGGDEPPF